MYRTLIPSILLIAVAAAPQNSEITYVKIQPVIGENLPPKAPFRESRIENIPLTIPGTVNSRSFGQVKSIIKEENHRNKQNPTQLVTDDNPLSNEDNSTNDDTPSLAVNNPLLLENEGQDNQRKTRSEETTEVNENETLEPTEVTESVEELISQTEAYESRTKAPSPRYLSKLSYFQKDDGLKSSIATNLVERNNKRRFKSKCRCEKIWNCPKLQISVPRCPNEYFMCCF